MLVIVLLEASKIHIKIGLFEVSKTYIVKQTRERLCTFFIVFTCFDYRKSIYKIEEFFHPEKNVGGGLEVWQVWQHKSCGKRMKDSTIRRSQNCGNYVF